MIRYLLGFGARRRQRAIMDVLITSGRELSTFDIAAKLGHPALALTGDMNELERAGRVVSRLEDACTPDKPGRVRRLLYSAACATAPSHVRARA